MSSIHDKLMRLGAMSGCHQSPERSFFIKGRQFPVCARCTGVFIGQTAAFFTFYFFVPHYLFIVLSCAVMFFDWLLQRTNVCKSNNIRRVITGILCGYSMMIVHMAIIIVLIRWILSKFSVELAWLSQLTERCIEGLF